VPTPTVRDGEPGVAATVMRVVLGAFLLLAGVGHLSWARDEFQAQVPSWFPVDADLVVLASGVVEVLLGASLVALPRYRVVVGWATAAFFVVIFPGNIAQFVEGKDGFGLDSDAARATRLLFQPVVVVWALWSTGAWSERRRRS
jgi:uncharacterized membrane protein